MALDDSGDESPSDSGVCFMGGGRESSDLAAFTASRASPALGSSRIGNFQIDGWLMRAARRGPRHARARALPGSRENQTLRRRRNATRREWGAYFVGPRRACAFAGATAHGGDCQPYLPDPTNNGRVDRFVTQLLRRGGWQLLGMGHNVHSK